MTMSGGTLWPSKRCTGCCGEVGELCVTQQDNMETNDVMIVTPTY